jgi:hypothetical protein
MNGGQLVLVGVGGLLFVLGVVMAFATASVLVVLFAVALMVVGGNAVIAFLALRAVAYMRRP